MSDQDSQAPDQAAANESQPEVTPATPSGVPVSDPAAAQDSPADTLDPGHGEVDSTYDAGGAFDTPEGQEPMSVADQKKAGVPDDETVSVADQKKGVPLHASVRDRVFTPSVPESQSPQGPSVAEQQAAGLPAAQPDPEAQHHEMPQPESGPGQPQGLGAHPDAGTEHPPVTTVTATSNESPVLVPSAQTAAAKAHAYADKIAQVAREGKGSKEDILAKIATMAEKARDDIEKYVPAPVLQAAETVAAAELRTLI